MSEEPEVKEFKLKEDSELRLAVEDGEALIELVQGRAELFGTELELHRKYSFHSGARVAIFSFLGATVEVMGKANAYVSDTTPNIIYLNTHAALEQIRKDAEESSTRGPRVMLVGPTDVGKSTVCRILCNYSVRMGRSPVLVDLDVGQGSISVPGTIGAIFINKTADVIEGFDRSRPLVFNYGAASPSTNLPLYDVLVKELAEVVNSRCTENKDSNIGGVIINTCGWVHGDGYTCLVNAAEAFEVDAVVVLDHERLYNDLQRDLPSFVRIVHQPKSGGIEARSREARTVARSEAIHRYFYGTRSIRFHPFTFEVNFSDVMIAKIGTERLPESCLPFGTKQDDHNTKVVTIEPSASLLLHHLLAVSPCTAVSSKVVKEPVLGFVVVNGVNEEAKTMQLLSPQQQLPSNLLVLTSISFVDDHTTPGE